LSKKNTERKEELQMSLKQRLTYLKEQKRAYIQGTLEYVNDEWVFFDEENEEAALLEDMTDGDIEVFRFGKWINGKICEDGTVLFSTQYYALKNGDVVRFRKHLTYAYEQWLQSLSDKTFFYYIQLLNEHDFSLYDCLYCYNGLLFGAEIGVNFIIYDNTERIANVQHYYERGSSHKDRFEITFSTGERFVCTQIG
jgi:hypothetical protein